MFRAANILLPDLENFADWSVVACDQYSSDPAYWNAIEKRLAQTPSTLHLILPEAWLSTPKADQHRARISSTMAAYLERQILKEYPESYIYVERTLSNGKIRKGLVGQLDLEAYDYHCPSTSPIRATEATILDRIPPRTVIRQEAILEFPHILLLQNDTQNLLFERLSRLRPSLRCVYDFDLMENGGHIRGYLIHNHERKKVDGWIADYQSRCASTSDSLLYAVGDGNHSLAAAKSIWTCLSKTLDEKSRASHPARYALAELENLQDEAQQFEPIHRILKKTDWRQLLESFPAPVEEQTYAIDWIAGQNRGTLYLDASRSPLPLAVLQQHLDAWLEENEGEIDYIHGEKELEQLAGQPDAIGFFLPAIDKDSLFETIRQDGSLPRKTFSMGHAHEKRYYLEGRRLLPKP